MDPDAVVETNLTVELKLLRADGTEELIGDFPVYQAVETPPTEDDAPGE